MIRAKIVNDDGDELEGGYYEDISALLQAASEYDLVSHEIIFID